MLPLAVVGFHAVCYVFEQVLRAFQMAQKGLHAQFEADMKRILIIAALAFSAMAPAAAVAGPIESACNRAEHGQASRALCRCIDSVARGTLTRSEQRRAARFFRDPDEAQSVRMSPTRRDNEFWARYRTFGAAAERNCS